MNENHPNRVGEVCQVSDEALHSALRDLRLIRDAALTDSDLVGVGQLLVVLERIARGIPPGLESMLNALPRRVLP